MSLIGNSSSNVIAPVELNLTPSSEKPSMRPDFVNSGSLASLLSSRAGITGTPILSSTCASVDSDSDYQGRCSTPILHSSHSRPISRSSSMSGVSTTANKDGIEGNTIHRYHDPQGYNKWISSTLANEASLSDSPTVSSSVDEDALSIDDDRESLSLEDVLTTSSKSNTLTKDKFKKGKCSHQQQLQYHQEQQLMESPNGYAPTPPNHPSAPPVTLNEKIRLLRTGSVSRGMNPEYVTDSSP